MKKYRLIKEYPGSSSLGTIFHIGGFAGDVSKYPEFFEEVVEKDYEILSYFKKDRPACVTTKKRGGEKHEEFWNIHSVKRLSDGEVFTIGDLIKTTYTEGIRILKFKNPEVNEYFIEISTGFTRLLSLGKVKQPIFLTHDGKDIFEGDTVWYVYKENFYHDYIKAYREVKFNSEIRAYFLTEEEASDYIQKNKVLFMTVDGVGIKKNEVVYVVDGRLNSIDMISNFVPKDYPTFKAFSNSKAAENYIQKNKVCLSYNDVVEAICLNGCGKGSLQELVNKKLGIK